MTVRTRFAPAPSGELHVGHAHTALFAWLLARHHGGQFVLRIEDTDPARSRPEFFDPICDALRWLGIDTDEGYGVGGPHEPYLSSQRASLHADVASKLEAQGALYRCWCTRDDVKARGRESGYDRFCRSRTDAPDGPYALRLAVPEGQDVEFDDLILGTLGRSYDELTDPVLVRSDGSPLYALAVSADDIAMGITHVVRGGDLVDSTFVQVLLYRALGADLPAFAHVPVVLGPDGGKLGKRHGSQSLQEFRRDGILGEAMLNQMALLGWSSPSHDEVLDRDRLVAEFTLERVNQSNSVFDYGKLRWLNQQWLKALPTQDLVGRIRAPHPELPADLLTRALDRPEFLRPRVETLAEIPGALAYLLGRVEADEASRAKVAEHAPSIVPAAADALSDLAEWTVEEIDGALTRVCERAGLNRRKGLAPLYVAISGRTSSLPLFDSIWMLGRDEAVARLRAF